MRAALAALLAGAAVFATGCETVTNPATGRREVLLLSAAEERELENELAERIEQENGLVQDPGLSSYVQAVGEALAAWSPRKDVQYRFHAVEMDEPNAFALPAGGVFVSRGLLLLMNSEAELANVLAHEIAHVAARHMAQQHAHVSTFGLATLLGNLASGRSASEGAGFESIGGPGGFAAFGRNQEREADRIGQEIVTHAGVDPAGMAAILRAIDSQERLREGFSHGRSYFSTHPVTVERIAASATSAQLEHRDWKPRFAIAPTRTAFLERLAGTSIGRPASEGAFVDGSFIHAGLGFALRFPPDWQLVNQNARVLGIAPDRTALVALELQGEGNDPVAAARAFAEQEGVHLTEAAALRVGDLPALRARTLVDLPDGRRDAEITWVAFGGRVYRLIGSAGQLRRHQGTFRSFARSFRPLADADRARLSELRLRVVAAQQGETLAGLSERARNEWDLEQTAIANGLLPGTPLQEGQLVKVAVRGPYEPPQKPLEQAPEPQAPGNPARPSG